MTAPVLDAPPADRERLARVALNSLFEPGDAIADGLLPGTTAFDLYCTLQSDDGGRALGDAREAIQLRLEQLRPDHTLEIADATGLRFVIPADDEWPTGLDDLAGMPPSHGRTGAPFGLWVRGPLGLDALDSSVAIVGSRGATSYGSDAAGNIAGGLTDVGVTVISGAAFGIDAAAHRGALNAGGPTVAVLACGADLAYPYSHQRLIETIARDGAVLSELPPGQGVTRLRFLGRNRLIAALGRGTVLVEAAMRSGARNTAAWTTRLNRHLMCVPGPITSVTSQGVHEEIRAGSGVLVTRTEDVLELISRPGEHLAPDLPVPQKRRDKLSITQQQVLDAVPVGHTSTAPVVARDAGVALGTVGRALVRLWDLGLVSATVDGWQVTAEAVAD